MFVAAYSMLSEGQIPYNGNNSGTNCLMGSKREWTREISMYKKNNSVLLSSHFLVLILECSSAIL